MASRLAFGTGMRRRMYRAYARTRVAPPPRIFVNSLPKAGTHLLTRVLREYPETMSAGIYCPLDRYRDPATDDVDWERVTRVFERVRDGQFLTGHFPASAGAQRMLEDLGFRTLFISRDPRDMAVSNVFYILNQQRHRFHNRFANALTTFDERLTASITGFPADEHGAGMPSVAERLDQYEDWWSAPGVYCCRFEDLVGERGGGSAEAQLRVVKEIGAFIDRPLDDEGAAGVAERTAPASYTFRKGTIGDWRNHFTAEHVALFKRLAGRHLIELGYEGSLDW